MCSIRIYSLLFREVKYSYSSLVSTSLIQRCRYSTSHIIGSPLTPEDAKRIVMSLSENERTHLSTALNDISTPIETCQRPSNRQLKLVLLESSLPFVGFGFLDNAIMIIAGEYIDLTIGVLLGISTMAAAAYGNLISDLCGLGLADSVEALCRRLGLPNPQLTLPQLKHGTVRWMQRIGRVIGITVGCLIGMAPLYWFNETTPHKPPHPNDNDKSPLTKS